MGARVEFSSSTRRVTARIAFSFISIEQARLNLERELGADRETLANEAAAA